MLVKTVRKPGEPGTQRLTARFGERLVCVRYRYDPIRQRRYKTVELIVEEEIWLPTPEPEADAMESLRAPRRIRIRIAYHERELRQTSFADEKTTCFGYTDHTDGKPKVMRLATDQFMAHVLWHVPVAGQHTIRQYGLYAHQARPKRAQCRVQLGQAEEKTQIDAMVWPQFLKQFG